MIIVPKMNGKRLAIFFIETKTKRSMKLGNVFKTVDRTQNADQNKQRISTVWLVSTWVGMRSFRLHIKQSRGQVMLSRCQINALFHRRLLLRLALLKAKASICD